VRGAWIPVLLALCGTAAAAPKAVTDPEVGEFARRAAGVALSRGTGAEDAWRKELAEVATPAAVTDIDTAWRLAGYDAAAEERPRFHASPGLRADVRRTADGRWSVRLMVAQSYASKDLSGARGLQVEVEVVVADPEAGRLAVERLTAR
jgi:hypothetical protein